MKKTVRVTQTRTYEIDIPDTILATKLQGDMSGWFQHAAYCAHEGMLHAEGLGEIGPGYRSMYVSQGFVVANVVHGSCQADIVMEDCV